MIGLSGWQAYLWDQALEWFERNPPKNTPQQATTQPSKAVSEFGAYG